MYIITIKLLFKVHVRRHKVYTDTFPVYCTKSLKVIQEKNIDQRGNVEINPLKKATNQILAYILLAMTINKVNKIPI
jgi:hypothetical protein